MQTHFYKASDGMADFLSRFHFGITFWRKKANKRFFSSNYFPRERTSNRNATDQTKHLNIFCFDFVAETQILTEQLSEKE